MTLLSTKLKRRIVIAVTSEKYGKELIDAIEGLGGQGSVSFEDIDQPVGLTDPSLVTLSINDSTRQLTVSPNSGSFSYFVAGKEIDVDAPISAIWPNAHGPHFFYLDENKILQISSSFSDDIITKYAFVSIVYWDSTAAKHIYFANEKHGIHMGDMTHLYLHRTRGAAFDSGGKLLNFVVDGSGSLATEAQFTAGLGQIWDEDIKIPYPAQATIPIFYRSGPTNWKRKDPDSYPVIYSGTAGFTGTTLPYNRFDGTNWSLTAVDTNKFVLVHVFATNDIDYPVIGIQGQAQYDTKAAARDGAVSEIRLLSGLPVAEFCPLGSVVFQTNSAYTNVPKAKIVSTADGFNYEDHRSDSIRPGSLA